MMLLSSPLLGECSLELSVIKSKCPELFNQMRFLDEKGCVQLLDEVMEGGSKPLSLRVLSAIQGVRNRLEARQDPFSFKVY